MLINTKNFIIFFGNKKTCHIDYKTPEFEKFINILSEKFKMKKLIFQKQIHSNLGYFINSPKEIKKIKPFHQKGDFLVTNQKRIGIGILTADCLPIILYDTENNISACIHAGWRGSVYGICAKTIQTMISNIKIHPKNLQVFFGPCAKACCYEVQPEFLNNLKNFKFKNQVIKTTKNNTNKILFDNVLFNKLQLTDLGLDLKNMNFEYNICTICNSDFYSYRRDGKLALRQISFITLK